MATLFQHTSIDEWTFHELKAWIYTLNLKNSQKKKLKKVIVEQEITGADINSLNSVKDIIESFPEINAKSAKKLYNALLTIRKETNNDDTTELRSAIFFSIIEKFKYNGFQKKSSA
eukprot:471311_1